MVARDELGCQWGVAWQVMSAFVDFAVVRCRGTNVCFCNSGPFSSSKDYNTLVSPMFEEKGPMKSFPAYASMLPVCLCVVSTPSIADEVPIQSCNSEFYETGINYRHGPDCLLSWVDNNQLQTVVWSQVEEDFQEASLHQDAKAIPVLTSSYWPQLVDVDQDGWLDMITFERVGQVNGNFAIFFFDPVTNQFNHANRLGGHTLERDMLGYVVTTGRSGAGWAFQFYTLANRELTILMEVEPVGLGRSGSQFGEYCEVSLGHQEPSPIDDILASNRIPDAEAFLTHYCDIEPNFEESGRREPLQEDRASTDRVPDGTIFYCVLEGSTKAVTIEYAPHSMFYSYGPVGGEAELELGGGHNLVRFRPQIADDGPHSGDITFPNGAYEYIVYKSNKRSVEGDASASHDAFNGGLVVYKDGDGAAPIFERSCIPERLYDGLFPSSNGQ